MYRAEKESKLPSFIPSDEIEETLGMCLDANIIDQFEKALTERREFEDELPAMKEDGRVYGDLRDLMKIRAYIEVLSIDPGKAPPDVKEFGVDTFINLLKEKEAKLAEKYPEAETELKPITDRLAKFYPEYLGISQRVKEIKEEKKRAGIKTGKTFKFVGSWPKGAFGQIFTVTDIDIFSRTVRGTLAGSQDPKEEWSVELNLLEPL